MLITRSQTKRLAGLLWLAFLPLLWWALREIPARAIWNTLRGLHLTDLLILAGLNIAILLLFSSRWWLILRAQGYRLPYLSLVGYRLAAFGVTYFTPGPQMGGEPLQVYLLQRRRGLPAATATASVTLDKLLELLANFAFLLVGIGTLLAAGVIGSSLRIQALLLAVGLLALPAGYLLCLWTGRLPAAWIFKRLIARRASPALENAHQFVLSSEVQVAQFCKNHPTAVLMASLLSLGIWIALVFEFALALHFLGLRMGPVQVLTILTAARVAFLLPIPAGLGTLEASQVLAMQALGLNPALGISLSLLIRARDLTLGGFGLWLAGLLSR